MAPYTLYFALKSVMERILGRQAFDALKESRSTPAWRKQALRLLKGTELAVGETVRISDGEWKAEIGQVLTKGTEGVKEAVSVEDVIAALASCYIELSFLQIGLIPSRPCLDRVRLVPPDWRLDTYRSPQYVQSAEQKEAQAWAQIQRAVGVERSFDLRCEWRSAKTDKSFSEWFGEKEKREGDRPLMQAGLKK